MHCTVPCRRRIQSFPTVDNRIDTQRVALFSLHSSPIARLGGDDAGGMNLYVYRLAGELSARGLKVDIFTRRTDRLAPETVTLGSGARLVHLAAGPSRRLPKSVLPLHLPALVAAFHQFVVRERLEYDVYHSHYWLSGQAVMRYRMRAGSSVPFIHMFHTLSRVKDFYLGEPDNTDSALRFDGERCLIGRADVIVGATESEAQDISRLYGRTPNRYAVIPPGVDLDLFSPRPRDSSRRRVGVDAGRVVLFVGRFDRLKGLDTLLYSVAQLPEGLRSDLKVLLVGGDRPRENAQGSRYRRLATKLGIDRIVEFRGKVEQRELPWYYSAANVCAVPSAYESFGMVATEAMACQTPVLAYNVGGLATTITDGQTGMLVPAGNQAAFAARLRDSLTSDRLETLGRRARMSVQRYTWQRTADRTLELYESLAREYDYATTDRYVSG
jgi:D-inositol-3-phosphate glycosyltransferase